MLSPVHEAVVDLVRVDQEVVLLGEARDAREVLLGEDRAGGVVGEPEQDRPRTRGDDALDVLGTEAEVVLLAGGDRNGDAAGKDNARNIRDVRRVGHDDLVALVERRAQREVDGLGDADRHEDLRVGVVRDSPEPRGVLGDRLAERSDAVVRRVFRLAVLDRADGGLAESLRRREVGLADAERDDAFDAGHEVEEAPDPARGYLLDPGVGQPTTGRPHAATFSFGRARWCGVARSYAAATRNIVRSW